MTLLDTFKFRELHEFLSMSFHKSELKRIFTRKHTNEKQIRNGMHSVCVFVEFIGRCNRLVVGVFVVKRRIFLIGIA